MPPMNMVLSFPLRRVLLAGLLLTVGACAGKVETTHESPDFSRADLAAGRLAVGGVVLSARLLADPTQDAPDGVPVDDLLAQADAWSPLLYGQLLAAGPDVPTWPWSALRDVCADSVLDDALATIARGGVLEAGAAGAGGQAPSARSATWPWPGSRPTKRRCTRARSPPSRTSGSRTAAIPTAAPSTAT